MIVPFRGKNVAGLSALEILNSTCLILKLFRFWVNKMESGQESFTFMNNCFIDQQIN